METTTENIYDNLKYPVKRVCPKCQGWLKAKVDFNRREKQLFHHYKCSQCTYEEKVPYQNVSDEDGILSSLHLKKTERDYNKPVEVKEPVIIATSKKLSKKRIQELRDRIHKDNPIWRQQFPDLESNSAKNEFLLYRMCVQGIQNPALPPLKVYDFCKWEGDQFWKWLDRVEKKQ